MNSYIKFNYDDDLKIFTEIGAFEDLTKEKDSDKHQFILPNFTISKIINTDLNLNGDLKYELSGSNQKKNTNVNEKYLVNDLIYQSSSFFSELGTNSNYEFFFKKFHKEGKIQQIIVLMENQKIIFHYLLNLLCH